MLQRFLGKVRRRINLKPGKHIQGYKEKHYEQDYSIKLDLEKAEEPEIKLPTSAGSSKKQESSRKTSTSALFIIPKPLTVNHNKLWKILQ